MKLDLGDGRAMDVRLTTEHAASSHGQPVLVGADGTACGPGDLAMMGARVTVATEVERVELVRAGYLGGDPRP